MIVWREHGRLEKLTQCYVEGGLGCTGIHVAPPLAFLRTFRYRKCACLGPPPVSRHDHGGSTLEPVHGWVCKQVTPHRGAALSCACVSQWRTYQLALPTHSCRRNVQQEKQNRLYDPVQKLFPEKVMLSVVVSVRGYSFPCCSTWLGGGEKGVRGQWVRAVACSAATTRSSPAVEFSLSLTSSSPQMKEKFHMIVVCQFCDPYKQNILENKIMQYFVIFKK